MIAAGIVLAGGRSTRMGTPKATLEWHGSTLLGRTVRILARATEAPVLVVRAPNQSLPDLPDLVWSVDDDEEGLGPLGGLAVGLAATRDRADTAFVCSTDLPFLHPSFVHRVLASFDAATDAVLPIARGHRQPLAAGYRTALAPEVARLLATGARKPAMLLDACRTRQLSEQQLLADTGLAAGDPTLASVRNVNDPEDYASARAEPPPQIPVQLFGTLAGEGGTADRIVRAATIAEAATEVEIALDRHVVAILNGERLTRDPEIPLTVGDRLAFMTADAGG